MYSEKLIIGNAFSSYNIINGFYISVNTLKRKKAKNKDVIAYFERFFEKNGAFARGAAACGAERGSGLRGYSRAISSS